MYEEPYDDAHYEQVAADLTQKITDEEARWNQNRFHDKMLDINVYLLQMKLNTCITLLEELGFSRAHIEAVFKQETLDQLKRDRAMLTQAKLNAQRPDIALPKRGLLGPNGQPLI
jgi:hypothetical protein